MEAIASDAAWVSSEKSVAERLGSGLVSGTANPSCISQLAKTFPKSFTNAFNGFATNLVQLIELCTYLLGSNLHGIPINSW